MSSKLSNTSIGDPVQSSVPATAMPLISPPALLQAHLLQSPPTRPSARSPAQPQPIDLNTSSLTHCNGSAVVKIGATTVVCGVRAEILPVSEIPSYDARIGPTTEERETEAGHSPESHTPISLYNLVVPNLELSTGCSPLHPANAAPSTQAQSLSQRLYTTLLTSKLIRPSDLEIVYMPPEEVDAELDPDDPAYIERKPEVKAFWVLYIDMICISYGGEASVFDAAWLSSVAALKDTIIPRAKWDADENVVTCSPNVTEGRRLRLNGLPVPLSFAVFVGEEDKLKKKPSESWVLIDPDAFEEQCCSEVGCITIDMSAESPGGSIVRLEKSGGTVFGVDGVRQILEPAQARWKEWDMVLSRALKSKAR